MKGFIAALVALSLVVAATVGCCLYVRGVVQKAEDMTKRAQEAADMEAVADYFEKEKAFLSLMAKESQINLLITTARECAALWGRKSEREAKTDCFLGELYSLRRCFGLNPL